MSEVVVATDGGLVALGEAAVPPLDASVGHLAARSDSLWAVVDRRDLVRSNAGGWERVAEMDGLGANCLLPLGHERALVGTSEARLLRVEDGRATPVPGFDEAEGRERWFTPWGGPPDVRSLAAGPDGVLYANVHVGGVLRSTDGGQTWEPTALAIETDVHQVIADQRASGTVLAATAFGLAVSRDAGDSWELHEGALHATYCRAVALTDDGPLVSASRGHHGRDAALYRFLGDRFQRCREGLPEWFADNVDTHCLDAHGALAALGTSEGEVFVSRDVGASWHLAADGLPRIRSVLLTDPRT